MIRYQDKPKTTPPEPARRDDVTIIRPDVTINANDVTIIRQEPKRRRGRPATGSAMTAAERKRKQRAKPPA